MNMLDAHGHLNHAFDALRETVLHRLNKYRRNSLIGGSDGDAVHLIHISFLNSM